MPHTLVVFQENCERGKYITKDLGQHDGACSIYVHKSEMTNDVLVARKRSGAFGKLNNNKYEGFLTMYEFNSKSVQFTTTGKNLEHLMMVLVCGSSTK
jgi:hypothetical protein